MNGGLALHVALALHGGAWLVRPSGAAPALEEGSSTFDHVRSFEAEGATSTADWFERLRADGVHRLELACALPRNADDVGRTAFAGVDPWALVAVDAAGSEQTWSATMTYVEEGERRDPWVVTLRRLEDGPELGRASVAEATRGLRAALAEATAVARTQRWDSWSRWFELAEQQLQAPDPVPRSHPDLAPDGALDLARRRLLAGAVGSWVFGGMGWWNDAVLPDPGEQARFEAATVGLYGAIVTGLMAVVNA